MAEVGGAPGSALPSGSRTTPDGRREKEILVPFMTSSTDWSSIGAYANTMHEASMDDSCRISLPYAPLEACENWMKFFEDH